MVHKTRFLLAIAAVVVLAAIASQPFAAVARAAAGSAPTVNTVTILLEAQVYEVVDTLGLVTGLVEPGDVISGSYTYDPTVADENADPNIGTYRHTSGPFGITLNVGGLQFSSDPDGMNFFQALLNLSGTDFFLLQSIGGNLFDTSVCATATNVISWQMDDASATALSSTDLPVVPLDLGDWESDLLKIESFGGCGTLSIRAHVTALALPSTYTFGGFVPPLLSDGSASVQQSRAGRTIPVKFGLTSDGEVVTGAEATIAVYQILDTASGTVDTTDLTEDAGASNDAGNLFRFDAVEQQYVFNLSTKGWSAPATYRIVVTLDDGSVHTVDFSLR